MNIYLLAGLIFGFGAGGGLINCIRDGARRIFPGYDTHGIWHSGWIGNLLLSGAAAVIIWGMYGPFASFDLLAIQLFEGHLPIAQLLTSVVVGMGGSRILTLESQKLILRNQRDAAEDAKTKLAAATRELFDE